MVIPNRSGMYARYSQNPEKKPLKNILDRFVKPQQLKISSKERLTIYFPLKKQFYNKFEINIKFNRML